VSFFLEAERFFLGFLRKKKKSIPQKKKKEEKRDRGVFVMLEIMLFVCYTSSRR
jgi:hypothetical protein